MKHHDPLRPIGKCKGCPLNLKTRCAGGLEPKVQWDKGKCKHCGDEEFLQEILSRPDPTGTKLSHLQRQLKATITATEPHHNELLIPGKMAKRARRSRG